MISMEIRENLTIYSCKIGFSREPNLFYFHYEDVPGIFLYQPIFDNEDTKGVTY